MKTKTSKLKKHYADNSPSIESTPLKVVSRKRIELPSESIDAGKPQVVSILEPAKSKPGTQPKLDYAKLYRAQLWARVWKFFTILVWGYLTGRKAQAKERWEAMKAAEPIKKIEMPRGMYAQVKELRKTIQSSARVGKAEEELKRLSALDSKAQYRYQLQMNLQAAFFGPAISSAAPSKDGLKHLFPAGFFVPRHLGSSREEEKKIKPSKVIVNTPKADILYVDEKQKARIDFFIDCFLMNKVGCGSGFVKGISLYTPEFRKEQIKLLSESGFFERKPVPSLNPDAELLLPTKVRQQLLQLKEGSADIAKALSSPSPSKN